MTITVRTLRNAVDAGFRKLSGAPLKLRRAELLATHTHAGCTTHTHTKPARSRRAWGPPR